MEKKKKKQVVVGILGFSQGARFAHLLATLHEQHPKTWFPHLKFSVIVAGYDAPIPLELVPYYDNDNSNDDGECQTTQLSLSVSSLHIWGSNDELVTPDQSEALAAHYYDNETYVHPGKHHVPTKGSELSVYIEFIRKALLKSTLRSSDGGRNKSTPETETHPPAGMNTMICPDEETAAMQREEVQALAKHPSLEE